MAFVSREVLPGIWQIQDAMGVCMTLLVGERRALLVDTGYGLENVADCVRAVTKKDFTVLLTHGHHDHVLGARWFERVYLCAEDIPVYQTYTSLSQRLRVLESAKEKGILTDAAAYWDAALPEPLPLRETRFDLGGLTAEVILCPGHTPGSCVVWAPERKLLLTGDDWNLCTWLFFPEALPVQAYHANVSALLSLPFEQILCSHQPGLHSRRRFEAFVQSLTDDAMLAAPLCDTGAEKGIMTACLSLPDGQILVFDREKMLRYAAVSGGN